MSDMLFSLIGVDSFPVPTAGGPIRRVFHLAKCLSLWAVLSTAVGFGLGFGLTLGYVLTATILH